MQSLTLTAVTILVSTLLARCSTEPEPGPRLGALT